MTVVALLLLACLGLLVGVRLWAVRSTHAPPVPEEMQDRARALIDEGRRRQARRLLRREVPTGSLEASVAVRQLGSGGALFTSWRQVADDLDPAVAQRARELDAHGRRGEAVRVVRRATSLSLVGGVRLLDALEP